jgi:hypothetical protein
MEPGLQSPENELGTCKLFEKRWMEGTLKHGGALPVSAFLSMY